MYKYKTKKRKTDPAPKKKESSGVADTSAATVGQYKRSYGEKYEQAMIHNKPARPGIPNTPAGDAQRQRYLYMSKKKTK